MKAIMDEFISKKEVLQKIHISYHTLIRLVKDNEIESIMIGNKRMYNLNKYLKSQNIVLKVLPKIRRNINYCRVSSMKQKEDLKRQISYLKKIYPKNEIISEVGSGLNNNRRGFKKILNYAINGEINTLVVAYKDRLTRFGYELIEYIVKKYSQGKIINLSTHKKKGLEEELTEDIISIMNIYVAKVNGHRSHKNRAKQIKKLK